MTQPKPTQAPKSARFYSYCIDFFVFWAAQFMGSFLGGFVAVAMVAGQVDVNDPAAEMVYKSAGEVGMSLGGAFWGMVAWFLNYGVLQGLTGSSLGKRALGIQVMNIDGTPIGIPKSILRSFSYVLSALPLYLGFVSILWNKQSRAWHDLICKTWVVTKPKVEAGAVPVQTPATLVVAPVASNVIFLPAPQAVSSQKKVA